MQRHHENSTPQKSAAAMAITFYLMLATLVCMFLTPFGTVPSAMVAATEPGLTDLMGFDFENQYAQIAAPHTRSALVYAGAFLMPEDFAGGRAAAEGVIYGEAAGALGDYGTLRMTLQLPPGHAYALAARNVAYAQRLFIDGREYPAVGVPSDRAEGTLPQSRRFVEAFYPAGKTTEIIIHYGAFVHAGEAKVHPMDIGYIGTITRSEQHTIFHSAAMVAMLVMVMVFFFGLFLFFKNHRYLLWLSLSCGMIAIRLLCESTLASLLPGLSWGLSIRIEYISNCCIGLFSLLYVNALFPGLTHRWVMRGTYVFFAASVLFIGLAPTVIFTGLDVTLALIYAVMAGCTLVRVLMKSVCGRLSSPLHKTELRILLLGVIIFVVFSILPLLPFPTLVLFGMKYEIIGAVVFLHTNMLALVLGFSRTERELSQAQQSEREMRETNQMLKRMTRVRRDFLASISHEMKTPLTVMSNSAQLTRMQLEADALDDKTPEVLSDISTEAQRLGRLVEELLKVSIGRQERLGFAQTPVAVLTGRAAAVARPILAKNGNRLDIQVPEDIPAVLANKELMTQVLMNLLTNANRHCENAVITLAAYTRADDFVEIAVVDCGDGIPSEALPRVFIWGESGDGSTGYGLAIAKDVIETHGGTVALESAPGQGVTVRFTLPIFRDF